MTLHPPITHTGVIRSRFRTISPVCGILVDVHVATDGLHSVHAVRASMLLALEWSLKRALGKAIASHTGMLELSALITVLERPYC